MTVTSDLVLDSTVHLTKEDFHWTMAMLAILVARGALYLSTRTGTA